MTLNSVLVATDFSDSARHAALRAATLARELGMQKGVLLHVAPQSALAALLETRATGSLEHALAQLAAELGEETGFSFQPRAVSGSVAREISRAAADFDLVVVGAYGMHLLRDFAIGTSAERLLRRTDRPVLVVKRKPAGAYRQVLAPVDFSPDARAAVSLARQVAPEAELHLLHAFEVAFESKLRFAGVADEEIHRHRAQARETAVAGMEQMITELGISTARVSRTITHGYPPRLIAETGKEIGADLVVIGKHGRSTLEDLLLGSVTLHTLASADCDVLVVPGGDGAARRR